MKKHEHVYSIDYYAYQSPLRAWNPAFKLLYVLAVLLLCLAENHMAVSAFVIVTMAVINIRGNRICLKEYLELMTVPLVFIIMGCAAIAVEFGRGAEGWYLNVTGFGILQSLGVMFRAFACVSALYLLALSTPMNEIVSVLRSFHIPGLITELMNMIYRYIFILMDTQVRIRNAAEARLGYVDFKTSCRTFGSSMGSLLAGSLRKAGMYYDAMESRCYDGELLFLEEKKSVRPSQIVAAALYGAAMIGIKILVNRGGAG